jgi:hypothetical protein
MHYPATYQKKMQRGRAFRELRSHIESYHFAYAAIRDADTFNPRLYWRLCIMASLVQQ